MTEETQILPCQFTPEESLLRLNDVCTDYIGKDRDVKNISNALKARTPAIADGVGVEWKQTVRDLYDMLHFGEQNAFNNQSLSKIVAFIEDRHRDYFLSPPQAATDEG